MPNVSIIVGRGNGAAYAGIVQFLSVIQVVAAGVAVSVDMPDPPDIVPVGADHVAFDDP